MDGVKANFRHKKRHLKDVFFYEDGGGRWIRTTEAFATDLQSVPFGHSGTPPACGAAYYQNLEGCKVKIATFSVEMHRLLIICSLEAN